MRPQIEYGILECNRIDLDYTNDAGSGKGDMFAYFPVSDFSGYSNSWVYLYSAFGAPSVHPCGGKNQPACVPEPPYQVNDGFEERAIGEAGEPVPEPTTILLLGAGLIGIGVIARNEAESNFLRGNPYIMKASGLGPALFYFWQHPSIYSQSS